MNCIRKSCYVEELNEEAIIDMMLQTRKWSWNEILEVLKEWYWREKRDSFAPFGFWIRGQRPIFVVYKLNKEE